MSSVAVLGPLALVGGDGTTTPVRGPLQRRLLATLAGRRGRVVTVDELVEALWGTGTSVPERPGAALQSQVHRLRRLLGEGGALVIGEEAGYRFVDDGVDAARFEQLVVEAEARREDPATALALLDAALDLWRGRAFADIDDGDIVRLEAVRLEERRATALEARAQALFDAGRWADAAAAAQQVNVEHPYRERAVAVRMRALARAGRHVEALRVYDSFRRLLDDELGVEPSPELRSIEREILRHEGAPTGARSTIGLPGNSFIGREVDLAEVLERIASARLVTLTGPGGVGKTRLAVHVAARAAERFPDGVVLCELAAVTDPDAVARAVASALRVDDRGVGQTLDRIVDGLRSRRALLVVDNCEHVRRSAAELLRTVLARAPAVAVLATSRQRLGVDGEHVFVTQPLAVPTGELDGPAVELFVDRALAITGHRSVGDDDRAAIRELCRRLDGLPLAIELAAARSRSHTPSELLVQLGEHMGKLADERRVLDRHRSIEAALDWSHGLLTEQERAAFASLSVFAGGFVTEAAAAVVGDVGVDIADVLDGLVEHSLLNAARSRFGTRFSMLEPVRQYAAGRLESRSLDESRRRHAHWVVAWAKDADAGLRSEDELRWVREAEAELGNLRAAVAWLFDHDLPAAYQLVGTLYWYAFYYAPAEVFAWADRAAAMAGADPRAAPAHAVAVLGTARRGDLPAARALAERTIDLARSSARSLRFVYDALMSVEFLSGRYGRAIAALEQALEVAARSGDTVHTAELHALAALCHGYEGRLAQTNHELQRAADLLDEAPNATVRALCDYVAGEILVDVEPAHALPRLERSLEVARGLENRFLTGIAGVSAASCAARIGDPHVAIATYGQVIDLLHRGGAEVHLWTTMRSLVEALTRLGDDEQAVRLHGALTASPSSPPVRGADADRLDRLANGWRQRLGDDTVHRLQQEGAGLGDERAIGLALAIIGSHAEGEASTT